MALSPVPRLQGDPPMLTAFLAIAATQLLFVALLFGTLYLDRDGAPRSH